MKDWTNNDIDGIKYDEIGRMKYHPDFHFSHRKPFTQSDLEYLCVYYGVDTTRSLSFALGKVETAIATKYCLLKSQGLVEHYRQMYWSRFEVVEV
ncbi:MAG TPA: DNA-entry nuclease [Candidatus Paenibacillus intestinavium]|nr:DNA-entry nuclease [Candidatus Paenibacillus intestinavium]